MRLFIAIHLGPQGEAALCRAMEELRRQGRGSFTAPENLHLTLRFLGEQPRADAAVRALQQLHADAFSLKLTRLGSFGDLYWAGTSRPRELDALYEALGRALENNGFPPESRAFQPHLTLCRRFAPNGASWDRTAVERAMGHPLCPIEKVSLMQSGRSRDGRLLYTELYSGRLEKGRMR